MGSVGTANGSGVGVASGGAVGGGQSGVPRQAGVDSEVVNLKNVVGQVLQRRGVLGKLKAQLRASVFSVIQDTLPSEGQATPLGQLGSTSPVLAELKEGHEGRLALSLVTELLQMCRLGCTLAVLAPEAGLVS
ncbi:hypothetical protein M427DRAFT_172069 [Gonapodya prolifera JEL478]|uniref:Uncharacterized protein n=1 Tax=Gonapodya prolifera (strain JEL478) TaxID=1344416 RepID=A0A139B095_GONPJ|nr:hypothetical protein M427DRAFT_172069 [Gonapodya prolifera JEL478]|eukprot:KXS22418.1 hypothetical protein M427DRAFT_172069 [Gonapodya prolifera JEL478]